MSNYTPRNTIGNTKYDLPEFTAKQYNKARIEVLLLESPAGLFQSHIEKFANLHNDTIDSYLSEIGAEMVNGFWVHPHYSQNFRCGKPLFKDLISIEAPELLQDKVVRILIDNEQIKVHNLLRFAGVVDFKQLILLMIEYVRKRTNDDISQRYIVSCFLFRVFHLRVLAA